MPSANTTSGASLRRPRQRVCPMTDIPATKPLNIIRGPPLT